MTADLNCGMFSVPDLVPDNGTGLKMEGHSVCIPVGIETTVSTTATNGPLNEIQPQSHLESEHPWLKGVEELLGRIRDEMKIKESKLEQLEAILNESPPSSANILYKDLYAGYTKASRQLDLFELAVADIRQLEEMFDSMVHDFEGYNPFPPEYGQSVHEHDAQDDEPSPDSLLDAVRRMRANVNLKKEKLMKLEESSGFTLPFYSMKLQLGKLKQSINRVNRRWPKLETLPADIDLLDEKFDAVVQVDCKPVDLQEQTVGGDVCASQLEAGDDHQMYHHNHNHAHEEQLQGQQELPPEYVIVPFTDVDALARQGQVRIMNILKPAMEETMNDSVTTEQLVYRRILPKPVEILDECSTNDVRVLKDGTPISGLVSVIGGNLVNSPVISKAKGPHKCDWPDCGRKFAKADRLRKHYKEHVVGRPFECKWEGCDAKFHHSYNLTVHYRSHTGEKPFLCNWDGCNKSFATSSGVNQHYRKHTGEKPFACGYKGCRQRFAHSFVLNRHTRIHTGEKPYKCNWDGCGKEFAFSNSLTYHYRTHTREKPYKCDWEGCHMLFARKNTLTVHYRKHTGERPYKCYWEGCNREFACSSNLNDHYRKHTGEKPYKCEWESCGREFSAYSALALHYKTHASSKQLFKCQSCGESFLKEYKFKAHCKKHAATPP